jgi:hypothetical protein
VVALGVAALGVAACSREDPVALDRVALRDALASDDALGRALKEADDAAHAGHAAEADDIFKRKVEPAADAAIAAAEAVAPRSPWGRAKKDALVTLERDRKGAVAPFETALHGDDLDAKLAAYEKQLDLERRAQTLAHDIETGP